MVCGCGVLICVGVGFRSIDGGDVVGCGVMGCDGMWVLVVEVQWQGGPVVVGLWLGNDGGGVGFDSG